MRSDLFEKGKASKRTCLSVLQVVLLVLVLSLAVGNNLLAADRPLIAVLSSQQSEQYLEVIEGFEQQVIKLYPDVEFVRYFLGNKEGENNQNLQEINERVPALLLTLGSKATNAGLGLNEDIPLVATMILEDQAIVQSQRATGVLLRFSPETQIEWLRRFIPSASRALILYNPQENKAWVEEMRRKAAEEDFIIELMPVVSVKELPAVLKSLGRKGNILIGTPDKTVYSSKTAKAVLLSTLRNRIPFAGISPSWVKAGALYSLSWDYADLGRQSGSVAEKILSGIAVTDITPANAETVSYVVNMKTADHLKMTIEPALIQGASKVYR